MIHRQAYIALVLLACTASLAAQRITISPEDHFKIVYDMQENLDWIEDELIRNPTSVDLLLTRARLRMMYGMDTKAMEDYEKVNMLNPYALYLHGFYGTEGYVEVIDKEPAEALVELTLEQRMSFYEEYVREEMGTRILDATLSTRLNEIIDLITARDFTEAEDLVEKYLQDYPESAIAHDLLSVIYTEQERYDEATEALSDAIALDPNYAMAWYNFGRLERIQGDYEYALEYFDEAISLRAGLSKAYFDRALVNKEMQKLEAAQADYTKLIELDSRLEDEAVLNRGLARKMSGDFEGAISDIDKAIQDFPNNAALYKNRGNLFLLLGQSEDALADYTQAIRIDPEFAEAYYNRGLTHYIMGDKIEACRDLKESQRLGFTKANDKLQYFCADDQKRY